MKSKILQQSISIKKLKRGLQVDDFDLPKFLETDSSEDLNDSLKSSKLNYYNSEPKNAIRKEHLFVQTARRIVNIPLTYIIKPIILPVLRPLLYRLRHYLNDPLMQKLHSLSDQNDNILKILIQLEKINHEDHLTFENKIHIIIGLNLEKQLSEIDNLINKNKSND
jgi:hypothetical protein